MRLMPSCSQSYMLLNFWGCLQIYGENGDLIKEKIEACGNFM